MSRYTGIPGGYARIVCSRIGHLGTRMIERDRTIIAHSHDCLERAAANEENEKIERAREGEGREEGEERMALLLLLSRVRPTKRAASIRVEETEFC